MSELKRIADSLEKIAQCLVEQKDIQRQLMAKAAEDAEKQKQDVMSQLSKMMAGGMKHGN